MPVDRQSPVVVGALVGCVAGVVAFLAIGHESSTFLNAAPVATSTQVSTVPNAAVPRFNQVPITQSIASVENYNEIEDTVPVEFELSAPAQAKSWSTIVAGLIAVPLAALGFMLFAKKPTNEERKFLVSIDDLLTVGKQAMVASAVVGASATMTDVASAYPIFAQQSYANPREATGRIVCANCHLASKQTEIDVPQSVLPDQVFEAVAKIPFSGSSSLTTLMDPSTIAGTVTFQQGQPVEFVQEGGIPVSQALLEVNTPATPDTVFKATIKVPYDQSLKQVGAKGKPADLNVGAVLILPEGFTLAPPERIPEKMKAEMNGLQFIQYSADTPNILVVGPVPGKQYEEMTIALLSPDPAVNKKAEFGALPVFVGGNRGRGQLYPTGEKSNNNAYTVEHAGKIADIEYNEKKRIYTISINESNGLITTEILPAGAELLVKKGDTVEVGQAITTNPNVGGFGQAETEIVLQDPGRIRALLFFSFTVLATQTMLVVKKKQYEQVQLSEMNF